MPKDRSKGVDKLAERLQKHGGADGKPMTSEQAHRESARIARRGERRDKEQRK